MQSGRKDWHVTWGARGRGGAGSEERGCWKEMYDGVIGGAGIYIWMSGGFGGQVGSEVLGWGEERLREERTGRVNEVKGGERGSWALTQGSRG